jgi:ribosomal protein L37AE/L43A
MICKLCKKREVKDLNPKIHICDLCRMEIELAFSYHINGKEVTKETYEKEINEAFKNG